MSDKITPIPREQLDVVTEQLCRTVAFLWLGAMSYRGADFAFIASRTGEPEDHIRQTLHDLIDGVETKFSLRMFAAVIFVLDMQIEFKSHPFKRQAQSKIDEERSDDEMPLTSGGRHDTTYEETDV